MNYCNIVLQLVICIGCTITSPYETYLLFMTSFGLLYDIVLRKQRDILVGTGFFPSSMSLGKFLD